MKPLYDAIGDGEITGTIGLVEWRNKTVLLDSGVLQDFVELRLAPVGYLSLPKSDQIVDFASDILSALASMHKQGWVHCHVNFDNTVKLPSGGWILIDLESAMKMEPPAETAPWSSFQIRRFQGDLRRWMPTDDVALVRVMIKDLNSFNGLDPERRDAILKCFEGEPTATVALEKLAALYPPPK